MDFFARQDQARRNTKLLVVYFVMAVGLIVAAVYLALAAVYLRQPPGAAGSLVWLWDLELFLWAVLGTVGVITAGSLIKIAELSRGGSVVANALGGRPVDPQTTDPDERKLMNVVEEMAIASGIPMPEVYVLDGEDGINAFAAGNSTSDAVVGVTRGSMRALSRDELQGVIAHEFSHILNGDMRLNLRLIGLLNGILLLAVIGHFLLRISFYGAGRSRSSGRGDGKGANPLPLIGLALLVLGSIGVFFGRLIKSAISRQREFLADAAAVQFTRNPDGLVGALKKIGGMVRGSHLEAPRAEEASHLFFGNALRRSWSGMFSTHPPLPDRIRAWEPAFDGKYPRVAIQPPAPPAAAAKPGPATRGGVPPPLRPLTTALPPQFPGLGAVIVAAGVMEQVGQVTPQHLQYAAGLVASLPDTLREAVHEPMSASALMYGLLLSPDTTAREAQVEELGRLLPEPLVRETRRLLPALVDLDPAARLPLAELSLPALRRLAPAQFEVFDRAVQVVIESDRQVDLFEYALRHMLRRHLEPHFRQPRRPVVQYYVLKAVIPDVIILLSGLAHVGHDTNETAAAAFTAGIRQLGLTAGEASLIEASTASLARMDAALDHLAACAGPLKRQILQACLETVAADGQIRVREAELLRAVADALDCPMPPLLPGTGDANGSLPAARP
jgi:Zn-dependent protease with chaperone function